MGEKKNMVEDGNIDRNYLCLCVFFWKCVRFCVCVIVFVSRIRWEGEIQQLTDLCLVSVTHKTQSLTSDQSHTGTLIGHIASVVSAV